MPASKTLKEIFTRNLEERAPEAPSWFKLKMAGTEFPDVKIADLGEDIRKVVKEALGEDGVDVFSVPYDRENIYIYATQEAWDMVKEHVASLD